MARNSRNKMRTKQTRVKILHRKEMANSEKLFELRISNEKALQDQKSLLTKLFELDKKRLSYVRNNKTYTKTTELFYESLNHLINNNIRNNTIDDFFKGWSANVRYLSLISQREVDEARAAILYVKRGHIIRVHFGWNVGTELRYEHYAVVVEKLKNRNPDNIMVVPLVSYKDIHKETIEEPDIHLGVIRALNKGKSGWEKTESIAKVSQMRTIDKLRIVCPKQTKDIMKIEDEFLSKIDSMICKCFTKN